MIKNEKTIEQKMIIVHSDGSSTLLKGDADNRPLNRGGNEDVLPSYISLGWKAVNATPFNESASILVTIQRELRS
jgi:hypothetical protein